MGAIRLDCHFDTERLRVESWAADLADADARERLKAELEPLLDPPVLEHLPPSLQRPESRQPIDDWIKAAGNDSLVQTVRRRDDTQLLGLLILAPFQDQGTALTIHLGYLFAIDAWGKGFATELLKGLVAWCADQPGTLRLVGGVEKDNPASAAVLRKAGFQRSAALSTSDSDMFEKIV